MWFNAKLNAWKRLVFFLRLDRRLYQGDGIFRQPLSLLKVRGVIRICIDMRQYASPMGLRQVFPEEEAVMMCLWLTTKAWLCLEKSVHSHDTSPQCFDWNWNNCCKKCMCEWQICVPQEMWSWKLSSKPVQDPAKSLHSSCYNEPSRHTGCRSHRTTSFVFNIHYSLFSYVSSSLPPAHI